jgi:hypothetical protein
VVAFFFHLFAFSWLNYLSLEFSIDFSFEWLESFINKWNTLAELLSKIVLLKEEDYYISLVPRKTWDFPYIHSMKELMNDALFKTKKPK